MDIFCCESFKGFAASASQRNQKVCVIVVSGFGEMAGIYVRDGTATTLTPDPSFTLMVRSAALFLSFLSPRLPSASYQSDKSLCCLLLLQRSARFLIAPSLMFRYEILFEHSQRGCVMMLPLFLYLLFSLFPPVLSLLFACFSSLHLTSS